MSATVEVRRVIVVLGTDRDEMEITLHPRSQTFEARTLFPSGETWQRESGAIGSLLAAMLRAVLRFIANWLLAGGVLLLGWAGDL